MDIKKYTWNIFEYSTSQPNFIKIRDYQLSDIPCQECFTFSHRCIVNVVNSISNASVVGSNRDVFVLKHTKFLLLGIQRKGTRSI